MRYPVTRRLVLTGIASTAAARCTDSALGETTLPTIAVSKDPNCGCCTGWVEHLHQAGFAVTVQESSDLSAIKSRLGVPERLSACHTAEVNGYVIEGHVPADAIKRLIREAPPAKGLAVPGMPMGSPGMEGGTPQEYEVLLFGKEGQRVFARYRGTTAL
jgi:hypothetical protein